MCHSCLWSFRSCFDRFPKNANRPGRVVSLFYDYLARLQRNSRRPPFSLAAVRFGTNARSAFWFLVFQTAFFTVPIFFAEEKDEKRKGCADGGGASGSLLQVGHLTGAHLAYFSHWDRAIDLEAKIGEQVRRQSLLLFLLLALRAQHTGFLCWCMMGVLGKFSC